MAVALVNAASCSFNADEVNRSIIEEGVEKSHGVRAAADTGNQTVRQAAFGPVHLFTDFLANDGLEVADHGGIGVGASNSAETMVGIAIIA